jgi:SET domain-containing protein
VPRRAPQSQRTRPLCTATHGARPDHAPINPISRTHRLDGVQVDATQRGGIARYANHCCEPNCYSDIITAGGKKRIVLYSKERIELGEEITYDYKFGYEEDRSEALPCCCGSKGCKGFLN